MDFNGSRILVTGSTASIGFAVASAFLKSGGQVMINGSNQERLLGALDRLRIYGERVQGFRADVRKAEEVAGLVQATVNRFGGLEILVNCAGVVSTSSMVEMPEDEWDRIIDTNLKGPFLVSQAVVRVMLAQGWGGRIVNIASVAGLSTRVGASHYSASKAGLIQLTKTMALELGKHGITANAVAPGLVLAEDKAVLPSPQFLETFPKSVPLGRVGEPADIVGSVLFLASPEARYITGEVITVDGGALAGRYLMPES